MILKTALKSTLFALTAGFVMVGAASNAAAQSVDRIAEADANGDGNIAWQEMMDMRAGIFARLDRNGDGVANSKDSPRAGPGKARYDEAFAKVKNMDTNGDGSITKSEMLNAPSPLFTEGDTNNDKVLSSAELTALRARAPQQ